MPLINKMNGGINFWTGYYTSRGHFKQLIRDLSNKFHIASNLMAVENFRTKLMYLTNEQSMEDETSFEAYGHNHTTDLRYAFERGIEAVGIAQHHDAITGTSPLTTISDYHRQFTKAMDVMDSWIANQLSEHFKGNWSTSDEYRYTWKRKKAMYFTVANGPVQQQTLEFEIPRFMDDYTVMASVHGKFESGAMQGHDFIDVPAQKVCTSNFTDFKQ